ncbi:hypothetical protein SHKM778_44920 [Streptomyces sp. KM77-8]|uniref:EamA domain-containing protein n=1 Tax=Streptomyces haneummycinicus TaxID=3074435 RepID=A0AAT9HKQ5_9ACTN
MESFTASSAQVGRLCDAAGTRSPFEHTAGCQHPAQVVNSFRSPPEKPLAITGERTSRHRGSSHSRKPFSHLSFPPTKPIYFPSAWESRASCADRYFAGLHHVGAAAGVVAVLLEPLTATLLAVLLGYDRMGGTQILGALLVLVSIGIQQAPTRTTAAS